MKLTQEQYDAYELNDSGYCTHCEKVTTEDVEPDDDGLDCEECGHATVMGMEHALVYEHIEISDEDEDEEDDNIISFSEDEEDDY